MRFLLRFILKHLARLTLIRYRPRVVGVTGSVGKTSTKQAILSVLATRYRVRVSSKNFNNEIGLPLAIIGARDSGYRNPFTWLKIFGGALKQLIVRAANYPQILILELGVDHPGDMDYLLSIVRPEVGVLTAVAETHLEFFGTLEAVAREKGKLILGLASNGLAVLNLEDERIRVLMDKTAARVVTFGFSQTADVWAEQVQLSRDASGSVRGLSFKLHYGGSVTPIFLSGVLGQHQVNVALAAAAVAFGLEFNSVEVAEALRRFQFPTGRMKLLTGFNQIQLIDDTYNSSPLALKAALKTLSVFPVSTGSRRWAVLGDMLELGTNTENLHAACGRLVAELNLDYLVTIGETSRAMGLGALERGLAADRYQHFTAAEEAAVYLKQALVSHDVVLIKGSQGVRLERVVKALMAEPNRAQELLVRQSKPWV